jgi:hypothetical protein
LTPGNPRYVPVGPRSSARAEVQVDAAGVARHAGRSRRARARAAPRRRARSRARCPPRTSHSKPPRPP